MYTKQMDGPAVACDAIFKPRSIVIRGASDNISKPGGSVLNNIKDNNFNGVL